MCGVTGFAAFGPFEAVPARAALQAMSTSLAHRGPDGEGLWLDPEAGVALAQRRLAIIDLSETGDQPMASPGGRYMAVFNGEIYGYRALRTELAARGTAFRGSSDTEVLLAAAEIWGVQAALERVNGMFALALYDRQARRLILACDRLGKKPLYIGVQGGLLLFGSELKALRAHPAFTAPQLDRQALAAFLSYGYIPAPQTIYREAVKLPPGHLLELDLAAPPPSARALAAQARPYWRAEAAAAAGLADPFPDTAAALAALEAQLETAVGERMVADVPVGAFLSGGIDSTLVTAMMQAQSQTPVLSFTVRFGEAEVNEADHAAALARHIGTDHHEVTATPHMALDLLERMPDVYDEPFADPSQLPSLLVSQLARGHLKVALSGDGGDESFGGYARYGRMMMFERLAGRVPGMAARMLAGAPEMLMRGLTAALRAGLPPHLRREASPDRLRKLAAILAHPDFRSRYEAQFSMWAPDAVMRAAPARPPAAFTARALPEGLGLPALMMLLDTLVYLPGDVLVKVDRASMAEGLEVRAPLLDYRVVETAWRMPAALRFDGGGGKAALRQLLARRVPQQLFDRPKQGFSIPQNAWLRGPLRARAADLFETGGAVADELDAALLRRRWQEHLSGRRNWGAHLWAVLMLDLWLRRWMA
ncbi:asparagine synthase (glutamine-hydrolyzing) [Leisingera sp. SS27]|uniref:asparagine synthase (glutamine-hydrolyzing) n=1 Tax=Leisingera sp. SS27 TaxID=2979462 RepID=UPI00232D51FA|nr:asparagine synthase (glutamine-hydrolyzing) [Leisingera sp. SS27]MDC0660386.1 asparagine synthase (glutamine-hydrolyzing) [Leisingera sp. SS27]